MIDRRKDHRVVSTFKSGYVRNSDGLHFATLRNISRSGVCFDMIPGVCAGDIIEFAFDDLKPLTGVVRWVKDGKFGVSAVLDDFMKAQLPQQFRPRSARLPLQFEVHVFVNGYCTSVKAHNLSLRGICVQEAPEMRPGKLITLDIAGIAFERATVRWCQGGYAGVCFAEAMTRHQFCDLADKLQGRAVHSGPQSLGGHGGNRSR